MSGVGAGIAIAAGVGAAGGIASGAMQSSAAGKAATTQANAADQAAALQYQASQNALGFQEQQYGNAQQELAPWLKQGSTALSQLGYLMGLGPNNSTIGNYGLPTTPQSGAVTAAPGTSVGDMPSSLSPASGLPTTPQGGAVTAAPGTSVGSMPQGGFAPVDAAANGVTGASGIPSAVSSVVQPGSNINPNLGTYGSLMSQYPGGTFQAPTADQARQTPGYQFALNQGEGAIQSSAAANGSLLTGGTMNALDQYAQGLADTNYNNVYNQALQTYGTNYNTWSNNQTNEYNRLASLSGIGQQTANQLATSGGNSANSITANILGTASNVGQQLNNAAAATASGYVGSANAWGNAMNGVGNNLSQYALLNAMNQNGGAMSYNTNGYAVDPSGNAYGGYV